MCTEHGIILWFGFKACIIRHGNNFQCQLRTWPAFGTNSITHCFVLYSLEIVWDKFIKSSIMIIIYHSIKLFIIIKYTHNAYQRKIPTPQKINIFGDFQSNARAPNQIFQVYHHVRTSVWFIQKQFSGPRKLPEEHKLMCGYWVY